MASESQKKRCFVVGPIGVVGSQIRVHADWLLEEIIEPVFRERTEYEVIRADKISQPGMIDAQIIQNLIESSLVIADLSHLNPNAFYEIGIRHMAQKPIIHMQLTDDEIPFDLSLYRAIKFARIQPSDLRAARADLKAVIEAIHAEDYIVDNPVTRVKGLIKIEEHATPEQRLLFEQFKSVQERLERLESKSPRRSRQKSTQKKNSEKEVEEGLFVEFDEEDEAARIAISTKIITEGFFIEMRSDHILVPGVSEQGFEYLRKLAGVKRVYSR